MKDIKNIAKEAKRALDQINNGKSFPTSYVVKRLETAAEKNPGDQVIGNYRDVIKKAASSNLFVNQKQLTELYHNLSGFGGGRDKFRSELGDLIFDKKMPLLEKDASSARMQHNIEAIKLGSDSEASKEFAGVFSLEGKSFSAHSDNAIKKAEKFAKVQLNSLGCTPTAVTAVHHNEHFILCKASVDTSDHTQVDLSVPVQLSNGMPSIPEYFIQDEKLIKLNKENLYVHLKDKQNFKKKASVGKYSNQRAVHDYKIDTVIVPKALEKFADLEDKLIASTISFSQDQVKLASRVLEVELKGLGVANPQIKVSSADERNLNLKAEIPTSGGRVDIIVPIEFSSGRPLIPSTFQAGKSIYKLNSESINTLVKSAKSNGLELISRAHDNMSNLSYDQLMDRIVDGVSRKDVKQAEDALSVIEAKFESSVFLGALDKFSKLLKHASSGDERDALIKAALKNGDLIWTKTSVEPYCPKLGLPASKVAFDEMGRPVPLRKSLAQGSGILINTSNVVLT
jgi:hypothetical protein